MLQTNITDLSAAFYTIKILYVFGEKCSNLTKNVI